MSTTRANMRWRGKPRPAGPSRPRMGKWAFERLAVQAFDEAQEFAGGTLDGTDRARIRAELASRFEVRTTARDRVKDILLTAALGFVALTIGIFLIGLV